MNLLLLDCCSLLNLAAGWGGLENLRACGGQWHVCSAVTSEALWVWEDDPITKDAQKKAIDVAEYVRTGTLLTCNCDSEAEAELYVTLAASADDGEAMTIAIAKSRGWAVVTDDQAAANLARSLDVPVVDTATVIQRWAVAVSSDAESVRGVVRRVTRLAKFIPPKASSQHAWWMAQLRAVLP